MPAPKKPRMLVLEQHMEAEPSERRSWEVCSGKRCSSLNNVALFCNRGETGNFLPSGKDSSFQSLVFTL